MINWYISLNVHILLADCCIAMVIKEMYEYGGFACV